MPLLKQVAMPIKVIVHPRFQQYLHIIVFQQVLDSIHFHNSILETRANEIKE